MPKSADKFARFREASDQSLLVSFGETIEPELHASVVKLLRLLQAKPIEGIRNLHPAYSSLLIKFDPLKLDHAEVRTRVSSYLARLEEAPLPAPREIEIPVCYGGEFGPDLEDVAAMHGITSGAGRGITFFGEIHRIFFRICSRLCVSGRIAERAGNAALGDAEGQVCRKEAWELAASRPACIHWRRREGGG